MIIGIDAGCLSTNPSLQAGVYHVAKELILGLARRDIKNTYILYVFDNLPKEISKELPLHFIQKKIPGKGFMKLGLPLAFLGKKPDVFLAVSQVMPFYHPFKTIGFIHGLDFIPEHHTADNSISSLEKNTRYLAKHADTIITTSLFLSSHIQEQYKRDSMVCPLGIAPYFTPEGEKLEHTNPYFLFVGSLKPSKNIPNLIRAFSLFLKTGETPYDVFLVGSSQWLDPEIEKAIQEEQLTERVHILPALSQQELPKYYRGATAFISVASYEGFGLPLIEAMACGVPVIAGNSSAEAEIIGDAGTLVTPQNNDEITKAMQDISQFPKLRDLQRNRGLKKSTEYSWERFVERIYTMINDQ